MPYVRLASILAKMLIPSLWVKTNGDFRKNLNARVPENRTPLNGESDTLKPNLSNLCLLFVSSRCPGISLVPYVPGTLISSQVK